MCHVCDDIYILTHLSLSKIEDNLQAVFSYAFSLTSMMEFWTLKFVTAKNIGSGNGFGLNKQQAFTLTNFD